MGKKCPANHYVIPSIADLIFCSILLTLFFSANSGLLGDGDTGYHIRAGEYILRNWSVPKQDIFSFHVPLLPWTAHEWLSEVIMARVYALGGLTGIVAFFAALLAGTTALLFSMLRRHCTDILFTTAVTMLAFSSSQIHWLARPHVFSFLLMITWQHLLETWQRDQTNRLYLLPVTMLLWVNLHGGFLGGFILLGAYLAGNLFTMLRLPAAERPFARGKLNQLVLTAGASLAVSLCNPNGYHILLFPFRLVSDRFVMDHVSEFLSPNFHEILPFKYLLLFTIVVFAVSKKSVEATELLLVLIFTNMALYSARYIPLFALIVAPILTRQSAREGDAGSSRWREFYRKRSGNIALMDARAAGFLWPATALVAVAVAAGSGRMQHAFDPKVQPVAAVDFLLTERISGNMFNNDQFGDYIIFRSYPRYKVFIDGRLDMYGARIMKQYLKVTTFGEGWEKVLGSYHISWIIFGSDSDLSRLLLMHKQWKLIYSDKVASIFVKDIPENRYLIDKYRLVKPVTIGEREHADT